MDITHGSGDMPSSSAHHRTRPSLDVELSPERPVDVAGSAAGRAASGGASSRSRFRVRPVRVRPRGRDFYVSSYRQENADLARIAIRRLFFVCDLPFHLAATPEWEEAMLAVSRIGSDWRGPSMEQLRTRELLQERDEVSRELDPIR